MMGCQPQGTAPHPDSTRYTLSSLHRQHAASDIHWHPSADLEHKTPDTAAGQHTGHSGHPRSPAVVPVVASVVPAEQQVPSVEVTGSYYPAHFEQSGYQHYSDSGTRHQCFYQQQYLQQLPESEALQHSTLNQKSHWLEEKGISQSEGQRLCAASSTTQQPSLSVRSGAVHYQPETFHIQRPEDSSCYPQSSPQHFSQKAESLGESLREKGRPQPSGPQSLEVAYLQPPPPGFTLTLADVGNSSYHGPHSSRATVPHPPSAGLSEGLPPHPSPQHQFPQQQQLQLPHSESSLNQPQQQHYYQHSAASGPPGNMLDKKPTLQVVTTDHSPVSPVSSTSSPRFIFPPEMQSSTSSGHSASSPFMSPVKREVKWEVDTLPQAADMEVQQVYRERVRMMSGDTDASETLIDSETGSSILEDSSSSREQSPFSAMAESLSLRSPSEYPLSPLARKVFQRQPVTVVSEDEGEEWDGGGAPQSAGPAEGENHPPKFKKRLHERYVLSLQDVPGAADLCLKEEVEEGKGEGAATENQVDGKRPVSKLERPESPSYSESPMPKSPRRSSSDTDMVRQESADMGASSCDEGDVFMEPTGRARTKHKPPKLHQREPLDLSRGQCPGFRSSSGSSPLVEPDHISPASKMYSPVFRSPHRLNYSPHALLSPQSQSPLCSVPEGGRIFSFNVPSPLEGAHSDSDLISPSPLSPRIFTFPPQNTALSTMSEVNRLAVSPRAPFTPPPFMRSKASSSGWRVESVEGMYGGKRSLSESDMTCLCPVCGQVFPTNDNLAKHMAKHLPTETLRVGESANKVHYCKVCNRSFSRSDMLTRHMRLHTGLKPYECVDCGQVFSRSDHLNTHRRTHTGEKPYRCPHCPYAACRRDMITRHMRTHAKRSSRRARYLSVPDSDERGGGGSSGGGAGTHGESHKPSGSISSTETTDSQEYSTTASSGHTCSVSSVDSVDCEAILSSARPQTYIPVAGSIDSLLSAADPDLRSSSSPSPSSRKTSDELESEEGVTQFEQSQYDRFMHYRKGRNWSTTSLESVDSEEAQYLREALVDDAFHEVDSPLLVAGGGEGRSGRAAAANDKGGGGSLGLETKALLRCSISPKPQLQHSSSS